MKRSFRHVGFAIASVLLFGGADWLQFRGNHANGVAADNQKAPTAWKDSENENENIAWKIELEGRGLSGPIVIGDRVVITSCTGFHQDRLHVLCFNASDGKKLWERQFWATGRTMCHPKMCVATPTPASDGKRIFAFYSSNDLACLDLDGNLLWYRGLTHDFPNASNSLGMASSPVVIGQTLVVQVENDADSFATGVDAKTGISRWKIKRTKRANFTSPTVLKGKTRRDDLALLQSSDGLVAVDALTGKVAWSYDSGASTTPSSAVARGTVFVPSNGLTALRPVVGQEQPEVLWQQNRLSPATPSPLVYQSRVYTVSGTVLKCADFETGKLAWQLRLKGSRFSSSPVAAGGHLYFFSEEGLGQVVKTGEKGELIGVNDLGETILGTPAIANGALYVRSDDHLWKIAEK